MQGGGKCSRDTILAVAEGANNKPNLQGNTISPPKNTSYQDHPPTQQDKDKKPPVTIHSSELVPQPSNIITRISESAPIFAHLKPSPINQFLKHFGVQLVTGISQSQSIPDGFRTRLIAVSREIMPSCRRVAIRKIAVVFQSLDLCDNSGRSS